MDLLTELARMGFTEYEAKVYLALLADSPATGYQLSKTSGVPRSMVYEALSRLHTKGAVLESLEDRAAVYRPLPPELLLERLHDEHLQRLDKLRAGMQTLYLAPSEERVWSLSGRQPMLTYARQMLRGAAADVSLVLNDADLDALRAEIARACERGVSVSALLTGEGDLDCGQAAHHPPLESELHGLTGMLLVVVDNAEALIADGDRETATITRNAHLVGIARQFVWMEFFTQRIYARLGEDLVARLDPPDRRIFDSLDALKGQRTDDAGRQTGRRQNH